ncbi:MAG: methyltransferase [Marinagarivorans sp.]|nr:methyltransferase [Marinagarivorans sp.]
MMEIRLRENCPESERLFDMVLGPVRWNLLQIGFEWGIFDILQRRKSVTQVAVELSFKPDKTTLLLDALTSLGFINKCGVDYQLNPAMAPMLLSDSPTSMRQMLLHLHKVRHATLDNLKDILVTGNSNHISANFSKPDFWDQAFINLRSFHSSLSNQIAADILHQLPQWRRVSSVLDIGAGSECLAKTLVAEKPALSVTIFDLPPCAARIQQALLKQDCERIVVIPGDYNVDEIGKGYDLIWASMSLYFAKDINFLLKNIRAALNANGVFVSLHEGLYEERTKPEKHVVGRFVPALNGSNFSFEKGFIAERLRAAGFSKVESQTLITPYGNMDLDIALL